MNDGRVWHVVAYPQGHTLHTTATYDEADAWRRANCEASVILPEWPDESGGARTDQRRNP